MPKQKRGGFESEVVFFADEKAVSRLSLEGKGKRAVTQTRVAMGNTGVPFDSFLVEDAEKILKNYKAAVFPSPCPSEAGKKAMELCDKLGIAYISASPEKISFSPDELRDFFRSAKVHVYVDNGDVVYLGNGYLALHSSKAGKKQIQLPEKASL